jgi:hypothetical protein
VPSTVVQGASEFRALAARHVRESELLLENKCPQGAVYMVGYAIECSLKARLSLQLGIPRWTRNCLDHLDANAFSHDLYTFAQLTKVATGTLRKVQLVEWDPQLRYHVSKISMTDGEKRHASALEVVQDVEALMGGI